MNAFCLPAGKVVVYTGLLSFVGNKDDQLATVLGHEISHALAHHASERIAREHMYGQSVDAMDGLGRFNGGRQPTKTGRPLGGRHGRVSPT